MARLVKRTPNGPTAYIIDGKEQWFCKCGLSQNQPFCDGSHKDTGIAPMMYTAEKTEEVWFCGCKATEGKPFCDGTHNTL